MLEIRHMNKSFGGVQAIVDFNMVMEQGQRVGIIGPNGAGKTTILNCISNISPADSGSVILDGTELHRLKKWQIAQAGVARTFQNIRLFHSMTVLQNVSTILGCREKGEKKIRQDALHLLEELGWTDPVDICAKNLPYGKQRKLELVRAIASEPKVLMLDEPAAGLNPTEIDELIGYINWLHENSRVSILMIEHRMEMIKNICEYCYVQNYGKTIAQGPTEQVLADPVVIRAYLGEEGGSDA